MINLNARWLVLFLFFLTSLPAVAALPDAGLALTDDERQWLQAHPTVMVTGDPHWLRYEAFDNIGNYIGIVADYL
jgi:hypothetical protein